MSAVRKEEGRVPAVPMYYHQWTLFDTADGGTYICSKCRECGEGEGYGTRPPHYGCAVEDMSPLLFRYQHPEIPGKWFYSTTEPLWCHSDAITLNALLMQTMLAKPEEERRRINIAIPEPVRHRHLAGVRGSGTVQRRNGQTLAALRAQLAEAIAGLHAIANVPDQAPVESIKKAASMTLQAIGDNGPPLR